MKWASVRHHRNELMCECDRARGPSVVRESVNRLTAEVTRQAAVTSEEGKAAVTREEAYFRTPPAVRVLVTAATGFTFAFLALLVADLDAVIYSDSRLVHCVGLAVGLRVYG